MRDITILFLVIILSTMPTLSQNDTLIYDEQTGNYIIQYWRVNQETGERDSLIRLTFEPATKIDPSIRAEVTYRIDSSWYVYHYEIRNGPNSKQNLFDFLLEFGEGVDVEDRSTNGWHGGRHMDGNTPINKYDWYGNQGLKPKWRKDGFILYSKGLPGIGNSYFQGLAPITVYPCEPPYELDIQIFALEVFPANRVSRKTVVPVSAPIVFNPVVFHDTLISYTTKSFSLGWIRDNQTLDKYIGYFTLAKQKLQENEVSSAKEILKQVLRDVDSDTLPKANGEALLTSEAYALIRYNTEYLIEQLPEQPELTVSQMLDTLRERLKYCYNTKQLGDKRFYTELDDYIKDAIKKYEKQDSIGCAQEVEEFYTKLRFEYKSKPKNRDKRYVTDGAYQLLYPLARQTETKVITLPARMTGRLSEQIEALKMEVRVALKTGMIGGEVLARNLERMLDRTVMLLQRQDTVRARMMMEMFLETVREVYGYTQRHPKARTYVKPAGYISLYYRGRYIGETMGDGSEEVEGLTKVKEELQRSMEEEYKEMVKEIRE